MQTTVGNSVATRDIALTSKEPDQTEQMRLLVENVLNFVFEERRSLRVQNNHNNYVITSLRELMLMFYLS